MDLNGWPMIWRWGKEELACVVNSTHFFLFPSPFSLIVSILPTVDYLYSEPCYIYLRIYKKGNDLIKLAGKIPHVSVSPTDSCGILWGERLSGENSIGPRHTSWFFGEYRSRLFKTNQWNRGRPLSAAQGRSR